MATSALRARMSCWLQGKIAPLKQWHRDAVTRQAEGLAAQLAAPAGALPEVIPFKEMGMGRKILGAAFVIYLGMNTYPIVSEGSLKHGVLLLQRKDEFFKRTGASRLTTFALTDSRRRQAVEWGAIRLLVDMIRITRDDRTRIAALKSISSLSQCDAALRSLQRHGARGLLQELAETSTNAEVLSLVRTVQDKMRKAGLEEEASHIPVGSSTALAL